MFVEIVELSEADNWYEAKLEWQLQDIYFSQKPGQCLCGHAPIKEFCILQNIDVVEKNFAKMLLIRLKLSHIILEELIIDAVVLSVI